MCIVKVLKDLRFIKCKKGLTIENILFLVILFVNLGIVLMVLSQGMSGNDYWWHVKTGEWILHHGRIPENDIFSWIGIEYSIDWIPHEWLSDVIFYYIYSLGGHSAVYLFVLFLANGFIVTIHFFARKAFQRNVLIIGCFLVFTSVIVTSVFYPRPQVFSNYIFLIVVWCLYQFIEHKNTKVLFFIPFITVLWSNLHGGFAMLSYVLCFILLIFSLLPIKGRILSNRLNWNERGKLLVVSVLSVLAIVINPIGFKVLLYPFINQGDNLMVSVITEWQAPDCKKPGEFLLYFIPIAFAIICFIGNRKRIRLIDFVYFGFFVFLFLRSVRFILLWYIFMLFGGLKYIPVLKVKRITHPIEYITTACATLGALAFLCYGLVGSVNTIVLSPEPIRSEVSSQMIQYIKSEDVSIRLFNDYDYGGELIFNDIPVFLIQEQICLLVTQL